MDLLGLLISENQIGIQDKVRFEINRYLFEISRDITNTADGAT